MAAGPICQWLFSACRTHVYKVSLQMPYAQSAYTMLLCVEACKRSLGTTSASLYMMPKQRQVFFPFLFLQGSFQGEFLWLLVFDLYVFLQWLTNHGVCRCGTAHHSTLKHKAHYHSYGHL